MDRKPRAAKGIASAPEASAGGVPEERRSGELVEEEEEP
jgi:hypothetical protein